MFFVSFRVAVGIAEARDDIGVRNRRNIKVKPACDGKFSLDEMLCVMKNKKAKVFDDFVIPCEATKKQNDFYRLAKIETELRNG